MTPSKPDDVTRLDPTKRIGDDQKAGGAPEAPPGQSFESYMEQAAGAGKPGGTSGISPFELPKTGAPLATTPTFDTLLGQVKAAHTMLGDMNTQLQTPNLKLKQSSRYLLRNKLGDANKNLKAANAKLGVELPETPPSTSGGGILGKFLNYISEGQSNLMAAQNHLMEMKEKGDSLNPGDFLAIQLKLAHAQQNIEYASIMLGKAVDDMKTLFNVQI
ncbi:MAG: hypothetical protein JSR58_00350 [Verrucomicrobia bacterium]|nr:hypothetical protein [Verrucomicrobiota bacterium]